MRANAHAQSTVVDAQQAWRVWRSCCKMQRGRCRGGNRGAPSCCSSTTGLRCACFARCATLMQACSGSTSAVNQPMLRCVKTAGTHLAAQAQDALDCRFLLRVHPAVLQGHESSHRVSIRRGRRKRRCKRRCRACCCLPPPPAPLTWPPLVTTDRYQRHLMEKRLSVCPSAGTSSAQGAMGGSDHGHGACRLV